MGGALRVGASLAQCLTPLHTKQLTPTRGDAPTLPRLCYTLSTHPLTNLSR